MELREDVPALKQTLTFGKGRKWGGNVGVSTRVLFLLATEGRIVRGRPRGSWLSAQYRWAAMESRLPGGIPDLDPATARARLVERWLRTYGPGSEADLRWWTGWPLGKVREALSSLDVGPVEVDTGPALVMADDTEPVPSPAPWAAFLPALDPTVMGYRERHWYLGERWEGLFDRNGNAGPTIWWCGRVVGGWGQRPDGSVVSPSDRGSRCRRRDTGVRARPNPGGMAGRRTGNPALSHPSLSGAVPLDATLQHSSAQVRSERHRRERSQPPAGRRPPRFPGPKLSQRASRREWRR